MPWPFIDERRVMRRPSYSALTQIPYPLPEGFGLPSVLRLPQDPSAPVSTPKTGRLPEEAPLGWSPEIQRQSEDIQKTFGADWQGPPMPPQEGGGGLGDWFRTNMPETHRLLFPDETVTTVPVEEPAAEDVLVLPEEAPVPTSRPEDVAPEAAPEAPAAPTLEEEIETRRAMLEQLFPARDNSLTQGQTEAQAWAAGEKNRARLMAQLAFAGGLTAAGGGNWRSVGAGLAAAGESYDKGFQRYHKALLDYGNLQMKQREAEYERDTAITTAAYKSATEDRQAAMDAAREAAKERRKEFMEFFKTTKPDSDEFGSMDPAERERWNRLYEYFITTGSFIPPGAVDVRDQ